MTDAIEAENGFNPEHEGKAFCGEQFRNFGCTQVRGHKESNHIARASDGSIKVEWAR